MRARTRRQFHRPAPRITAEQVEDIRQAVSEALEQSSLRAVAVEIGLGHSTLHNFASGANPHPRVRRLLHDWHTRRTAAPRAIDPARLDAITEGLPGHVRIRLRPFLAQVLVRGYVESGLEAPTWLASAASAARQD